MGRGHEPESRAPYVQKVEMSLFGDNESALNRGDGGLTDGVEARCRGGVGNRHRVLGTDSTERHRKNT